MVLDTQKVKLLIVRLEGRRRTGHVSVTDEVVGVKAWKGGRRLPLLLVRESPSSLSKASNANCDPDITCKP
jgi:hypothetical protein